MGKVVRLTERDLNRLIKKVIKEGVIVTGEPTGTMSVLPQGAIQGTWRFENNRLYLFDDKGGMIGDYIKG